MIAQKCFQTCGVNLNNLSIIKPLTLRRIVQQLRVLSSVSGNDPTTKSCLFNPAKLSFRFKTLTRKEINQKNKVLELTDDTPVGFYSKCKFYFKRYGYIAIPVHCASSTLWLCAAYLLVKSGVNIIDLLQWFHIPEVLIEKIKSTPESAGVLVVTLILYKIIAPLRYGTTLAGIQLSFWTLQRFGKLKTVKEISTKASTFNEQLITNIAAVGKKVSKD